MPFARTLLYPAEGRWQEPDSLLSGPPNAASSNELGERRLSASKTNVNTNQAPRDVLSQPSDFAPRSTNCLRFAADCRSIELPKQSNMNMGNRDRQTSSTVTSGHDQRVSPIKAKALEIAITACGQAWTILDQELRADDFEDEMISVGEGSRYEYYCELDGRVLEDAESVYFNSSEDQRRADDRDLKRFEARFKIYENFSPRIKALALRMLSQRSG